MHYLHHDIVAKSSDFFDKALNGRFAEKDGQVKLPHEDARLFAIYAHWLYFGPSAIVRKTGTGQAVGDKWLDGEKETQHELPIMTKVKLYVLGEMLQDDQFRDDVMDSLISWCSKEGTWPTSCVPFVEKNLPESSPMRKFLVRAWAVEGGPRWFTKQQDGAIRADIEMGSQKFWAEVAETAIMLRKGVKLEGPCERTKH